MRSWLATLVTCGGLIGCNDHGAAALTSIKTKVCACKTASCAEQEMQQVPQRAIASNHRTQGIARDMLDCFAKLQAGERPSTDPDEEGSATAGPAATPAAAAAATAAAPTAAAPTAAAPTAAASTAAAPTAPTASTVAAPTAPTAAAPTAAPAAAPTAAAPTAARPAPAKPQASKKR